MKATLLCSVALLASLTVFAQPKPLIETYEVRVTSIEVVVTDSSGKPIRGLDRSQFTILEDGAPQEITNFSEVDLAGVAGVETERIEPVRPDVAVRHIQIFIDEYSADPFQRQLMLEKLREMLDLTLSEGDEVSIVRWTRRLKVELPFTRDLGRVSDTIERIKDEGAQGATFASERRIMAGRVESNVRDGAVIGYPAAYQQALSQARAYGEELRDNLRTLAEDMKASMSAMGGLNGRKMMVFVGENLPRNPGIEMFEIADRAFEPYLGRSADSKNEAIQRGESLTIQGISRAANANGVSFYAVSSGNLASSGKSAIEGSPLLGLESVQALTFMNSADTLQQIAGATGGATSLDTNSLDSMLRRLANDLQSYYSIGYRPSDSDDGVRSIEVEVDVPGAIVRTRDAFVAKSTEEDLGDRALSCLFRQRCETDFMIEILTGEPKKKRWKRWGVPIEVRIPMASLTIVPQRNQSAGGFSVHIAAVSENGGLSEVVGRSQRVNVPNEDLSTVQDKYLTWTAELVVEKGRTKIVVAVSDEVSQLMGFGKTEVTTDGK